jgi:GntR family transcriptional regulator / MocR family aminotransferase
MGLSRRPGTPLYRGIYGVMRTAITEGRLPGGTLLPPTRTLATDLGISRATVLAAYEQLTADGYIDGRRGGGTRVSGDAPRANTRLPVRRPPPLASATDLPRAGGDDRPAPFALGVPALDEFPIATWARLTARRWRATPRSMLAPADGAGFGPLREAIAEHVVTLRGIRCTAEQVVITAGAQQAFGLLARLIAAPGSPVWVEEFGYGPARTAFASAGAVPIGVLVDPHGFDVARARAAAPRARLALVTPACQAPYGIAMSPQRRLELLDWAEEMQALILEDDYNGELRYEGKAPPALAATAHPGARRVVYIRTFTKTLFPALRLGFVVLPGGLIESFTRARTFVDRHSPNLEQAVLADFIASGYFSRHVRRVRELYAARQQEFLELARQELGPLATFRSMPAGLRIVGDLQPDMPDVRVADEAAKRGVRVEALSSHCLGPTPARGLVFGYAPFRRDETRAGLAQVAEAIRHVRRAVA